MPDPVTTAETVETDTRSNFLRAADGLVLFIARHWLAIFNTAFGLYVIVPLLAPILLQVGLPGVARPIYALYSVTCHQIPDHSYFVFGPNPVPDQQQLVAAGMTESPNVLEQRKFTGNEEIGFKIALCERDLAIYGTVFVGGLLFAIFRKRLRPLPFKWLLLAMVPMGIDGLTQLFGWRESNWWLRTLTGGLFGLAGMLWIYPYVDAAMRESLRSETARVTPSTPPSAPPTVF